MDGTSSSGAVDPRRREQLVDSVSERGGSNSAGAGKFTQVGIYRVEATSADSTRKARLMLPVSGPEVGASSTSTTGRASTGATLKSVKGKFTTAKTRLSSALRSSCRRICLARIARSRSASATSAVMVPWTSAAE
jgi:hypothetical protein